MLAERRRRAAVAAWFLLQAHQQSGPQGPKRRKTPFCWEEHEACLTEQEFKARYRLTKESFAKLLSLIRPALDLPSSEMAVRNQRNANCNATVPAECVLACGLRMLAGGQACDLKLVYKMSMSQVYKCLYMVVDAVNATLKMEFPIDDLQKLQELEAGFAARSLGGVWRGQVGAVDGCHITTEAPPPSVPDAKKYYVARKGKYALLLMAVADAQSRFLFCDISQVPTTHDSLAWSTTTLGQRLRDGDLPEPFFISGDSAFSLSNSLITPSSGTALYSDAFDYVQSSERIPVECAFGILVRRWGIFWRPLALSALTDGRAVSPSILGNKRCFRPNLNTSLMIFSDANCITVLRALR
jgi:hypothetical protein